LTETSEAVLAGDIAARPASLGNALPCKYCRFGAVCQLDTRAVNARLLPKLDEDAAFQKICESLGEVNNGMDS
jgi:ATP-dependent helicase/DNAse subunit B